jgi:hypothetical protein
MVSAASDRSVHRFITPIDATDTVKLHSFAGTKESVLCLGSTYEQIISKAIDDSLAVNVFRTYVLFTDSPDINILSTDDQVISGGSVHFGTNDRTTITQTVAGQERQYDLTGGGSYLVSALGGAIQLRRVRKLHYLVEYTHDPSDQTRQRELQAIQADVRYVYGIYSEEVRMKSYSVALEMAIGNKQHGFAVSALRSHASLPPFPPCLTHFDPHRDPNSECNPVADLVDSFARAQVYAQKFGDDEHQLQRDELFRRIQCATQQLQDLTPNLHGINSLHVSPVLSNHVSLDFRGTELVNPAGPEVFVDPFAEPDNAFDGNSASIEINNLEDDSSHTTATRTPESVRRAGMFSPYGLRVMVVQTGAALALFA